MLFSKINYVIISLLMLSVDASEFLYHSSNCCEAGRAHANNIEDCNTFSTVNDYCSLISHVCCEEQKAEIYCEKQKSLALNDIPCEGKCCECCRIGILTRKRYNFCQTMAVLETQCEKIYKECCVKSSSERKCDSIDDPNCKCSEGFGWNERLQECRDNDECSLQTHNCSEGYRCENTIGGFKCVRERHCGTGYTVQHETQRCVDIDECETGIHNCGRGMICVNLPGTFKCIPPDCGKGHKFDTVTGTCIKIRCPIGFEATDDGKCRDIDECRANQTPCKPSEICQNTIGSYRCIQTLVCPSGFQIVNGVCEDIDECSTSGVCVHPAKCVNLPGSYICECPEGFRQNKDGVCVDIDECETSNICPEDSVCENTEGSFECKCKQGFQWKILPDGRRICEDIDECKLPNSPCAHICVNLKGSFFCLCHPGYMLAADKRNCDDIDECAADFLPALCNYKCINTNGSYECICPPGYKLDDAKQCRDIDECKSENNTCPLYGSICVNTKGGYRCLQVTCPPGYKSVSSTHCQRDCSETDPECALMPFSYFFAYLALPSRMSTPSNIFILRMNVHNAFQRSSFSFKLVKVITPHYGIQKATEANFMLRSQVKTQAELFLVKPLVGPQDVYIDITTNLHDTHGRGRIHSIVRLTLFVGPYEF